MKSFFKGIGILIAAVLLGCCLGCFSQIWANAKVDLGTPIVVSVIVPESKNDYESKYDSILREQIRNCTVCTIRNVTPYSPEGQFMAANVAQQLEVAGSSSSFVFLGWNTKSTEETKAVVNVLKKLVEGGVVVIAAAGLAQNAEPTLPLNKTVAGQVPGVVIIGELAERERLLTQSYFGPEMLTALKPPREHLGQGMGPLFFVSRLAIQWNRKTGPEWLAHFQSTKHKVRRIWPDLDDFFGR